MYTEQKSKSTGYCHRNGQYCFLLGTAYMMPGIQGNQADKWNKHA